MNKYILIAVLLLTGCLAKYKDVSESPEYKPFINARYSLGEGMVISGVNAPPGYGEEIDFYLIDSTSPSWGGRELISREALEVGSVITVKSVRECANCFGAIVKAIVTLEPYVTPVDAPIFIDVEYIRSEEYAERME